LLLALPESSLVLLPHVGPYSSNAVALGIYPTLSFLYEKKGNWQFFDFKKLKKLEPGVINFKKLKN
jgi:hypothetical protein